MVSTVQKEFNLGNDLWVASSTYFHKVGAILTRNIHIYQEVDNYNYENGEINLSGFHLPRIKIISGFHVPYFSRQRSSNFI